MAQEADGPDGQFGPDLGSIGRDRAGVRLGGDWEEYFFCGTSLYPPNPAI